MFKRTLFAAAVMAMPMMAQAQNGFNENRAVRISTKIATTSTSIAQESRQVAQRARSNDRINRAQKFRALAQSARQLRQKVNREVIPVLQSRIGNWKKKQVVRSLRPYFQSVYAAESSINRMPYDIKDLLKDLKMFQNRLKNVVFNGGPGGPAGKWTGSCEVVLETLWGTDVRSFYGQAKGQTRQVAKQKAKAKALNKCSYYSARMLKCTVNHSQCGASRF